MQGRNKRTPLRHGAFMQEPSLKNIRRLLAFGDVHVTVRRNPYPPHGRSNQRASGPPNSLRYQLKVHRLELHLTQADVAEVLGVHAVSI